MQSNRGALKFVSFAVVAVFKMAIAVAAVVCAGPASAQPDLSVTVKLPPSPAAAQEMKRPEIVLVFRGEDGSIVVEGEGAAAHIVAVVDQDYNQLGIAQVSIQGLWRVVIEASRVTNVSLKLTPVTSPLLGMFEGSELPAPYPVEREDRLGHLRALAISGGTIEIELLGGDQTSKALLYQSPSPDRWPTSELRSMWLPPVVEEFDSYHVDYDPFLATYYVMQPIPIVALAAGLTSPTDGLGALGVDIERQAIVAFATNRDEAGSREDWDAGLAFRAEFGARLGPLVMGLVEMKSFRSKGNPKSGINWLDRELWSEAEKSGKLQNHIAGRKNTEEVLVIVHGCCVNFETALKSAAKLIKDTRFEGAGILFSWPAAGYSMAYRHDVDKAVASRKDFVTLLGNIAEIEQVKHIHVVAHSLGNQIFLEALKDIGAARDGGKISSKLGQLVFASPDVDDEIFQQTAAAILPMGKGATLYASSRDKPLRISGVLAWGGSRAGFVGRDGPVVVKGVDSIDVTNADSEWFGTGHSLFASALPIVNDLSLLIAKGERPPNVRFPVLETVPTRDGPYWRYPPRN